MYTTLVQLYTFVAQVVSLQHQLAAGGVLSMETEALKVDSCYGGLVDAKLLLRGDR